MLKKILLRNFQSHRKSQLELDPGINVIVGTSDVGKSSIIRALRWATIGKPIRNRYPSHWGGKTIVDIETDEGTIRRVRDRKSHFELGNIVFKANRTDVPTEIQQVINLNDSINFQRQIDRPFLLDSSPYEIAKHFNHIAYLDVIDYGLKYVNSKIHKIRHKIEFDKAQMENLTVDLNQYQNLTELENQVIEVERKRALLKTQQQHIKSIQERIDSIEKIDLELKENGKLLVFKNTINWAIKKYKKIDQTKTKLNRLTMLVNKIVDIQQSISEMSKRLDKLSKTYKRAFPNICPLCGQRRPNV